MDVCTNHSLGFFEEVFSVMETTLYFFFLSLSCCTGLILLKLELSLLSDLVASQTGQFGCLNLNTYPLYPTSQDTFSI